MYIRKTKKKEISFTSILLNILYPIFLFILFILFLAGILYIFYKFLKNYLIKKYFKVQLSNIYYNPDKEVIFNYNFKINDYILINTEKYQLEKIIHEGKNNLILILDKKKKIKISFQEDENKYEIFDYENDEKIESFKYISRKPFNISNCIEFIYILYHSNTNINTNTNTNTNINTNANTNTNTNTNTNFPAIKSSNLNIWKNFIKLFKIDYTTLQNNIKDINTIDPNTIQTVIAQLNNNDNQFLKHFKDLILDIITKGLYNSKICNLKFDFVGSKKIKKEQLSEIDEIIFRGIYYEYQNEIYENDYRLITLNNIECNKDLTNCKEVINNSLQPNLLFILLDSSINNYSNFDKIKSIIDVNTFFYPRVNILMKELSYLFIENYVIYTTNDYNEYDAKKKNSNKLLFIDYNIILFLLRYSIYDFLRVLYNQYDGICYKFNNKLIYVKLNNIEEKKIIYNNI